MTEQWKTHCTLCPRACGTDRTMGTGQCGCGAQVYVAKTMLHHWEEPVISGTNGSGAIFFAGCPLHCGYCQNVEISRKQTGKAYDAEDLRHLFLDMQRQGAHNVNLVTAGHFLPVVAEGLRLCANDLHIPVVYNSSGYETVETLRLAKGLISVFLPDFKYAGGNPARELSHAPDYPAVAERAIDAMVKSVGPPVIENGLIQRGVIVRHLCLPSLRKDSIAVVERIATRWGSNVLVSLMRQYTPDFNRTGLAQLNRKITSFEYESVVRRAVELGLNGFMQEASSAVCTFTPDFKKNMKDALPDRE